MQPTTSKKTRGEKAIAKQTEKNEIGCRKGTMKDLVYQALKKGGSFEEIIATIKKTQPKVNETSVRWYITDIRKKDGVDVQLNDGVYSIGGGKKKAAAAPAKKAAPKKAEKKAPAKKAAPKKAAKKEAAEAEEPADTTAAE